MSEKHNQLRDLAIAWLKKHNYSDIEIEVKIPNYSGKNYKGSIYSNKPYYSIDVVGRGDGKKIAVECGGNQSIKLDSLLGLFNEVWVLPYGKRIPFQWREGMVVCQNCGHIV